MPNPNVSVKRKTIVDGGRNKMAKTICTIKGQYLKNILKSHYA